LSQVLVKEENGVKTFYVYGLGLIGEEKEGEYRSYHFDFRGSTVALTDKTGKVVERFQYGPYGELLKGDAAVTPFLFNGKFGVMTDGNGLYYMRARFYSAVIKRFVNQDVLLGNLSEGQTLNRYAFVTGRPLNLVDPFGLDGIDATLDIWLIRGVGGLMCAIPVPIAQAVGVGIIMLTLSGDTPKTQTLPGEGLAPPGDCGQGYYDFLKEQKELICNQPRACSKSLGNCSDIISNLALNNACVKARDDVMKKCFRGGDKRHQKERESARKSVTNCIIQAQINSCPGF